MNQLFVAILSGLVFYFVLSISTELSKKERIMLVCASLLFALIGYSLYTLLSLGLLLLTLAVLIMSGGALIYTYNKRTIEQSRNEEVRSEIEEQLENKEKLEIDDALEISSRSDMLEEMKETPLPRLDFEMIDKEVHSETTNIDSSEEVVEEEIVEQEDLSEDTSKVVEEIVEGIPDIQNAVELQDGQIETIQENVEITATEDHPKVQPEQDIQEEQEVVATEEIERDQPQEEPQQDLIEDNEQQRDELLVESQDQMEASEVLEEELLPSEQQALEEITEIESVIEETSEQLESESIEDTDLEPSENEEDLEEVEIPETIEIKPIDKQVLQLLIDQLVAYKPMLDQEEYESLLIHHIHRPLHQQDYYIFVTMLRDFYMETSQWGKLTLFLNQVKEELKDFPIILAEIQYVIEQYQDIK